MHKNDLIILNVYNNRNGLKLTLKHLLQSRLMFKNDISIIQLIKHFQLRMRYHYQHFYV